MQRVHHFKSNGYRLIDISLEIKAKFTTFKSISARRNSRYIGEPNFKAKTPVMKRYLNLIQTLYTVNHNFGIDSCFNATSIYDNDFAPLPSPTVDEFFTVTHFSIDSN